MSREATQHISVPEFGRISRATLGPAVLRQLQRLDEHYASRSGVNVFDWGRTQYIRALNHVGVVIVGATTIEILPKIDVPQPEAEATGSADAPASMARQNLLYMLSLARRVPIEERDLAPLRTRRLPILEALIALFVEKLLFEFGRGLHHEYVHQRKTLPYVKGKILLADQVRLNRDRPDLLRVAFDEFVCDTLLNRILKAACRRLLTISRSPRIQQRLRESLLMLSEVSDTAITPVDFETLQLDRRVSRFETVLNFARMVLTGWSPAPQHGSTRSFSFLFPMDQLFEEFIGAFIKRYAAAFGLSRARVHVQARGRRRWLLRSPDGSRRFKLIPDVVIDGPGEPPQAIIDTKWKRLAADVESRRNGVAQSDIYQLYAYANRYESTNNILLYPKVSGATPKAYRLDGPDHARRIRIEFVDLGVDLWQSRERLLEDLRRTILLPGHSDRASADLSA